MPLIPPDADAEFVRRMEDVIETYLSPYDPAHPAVCFDEAHKQLFGPGKRTLKGGHCTLSNKVQCPPYVSNNWKNNNPVADSPNCCWALAVCWPR